eukprot:187141-Prymnesium_polylepis.2
MTARWPLCLSPSVSYSPALLSSSSCKAAASATTSPQSLLLEAPTMSLPAVVSGAPRRAQAACKLLLRP